MKFLVNRVKVEMKRVPFVESPDNYILIMTLDLRSGSIAEDEVYEEMARCLLSGGTVRKEGGMMWDKNGDGTAEIRLLCGFELPTLQVFMNAGMSVVQVG